MVKNSKNIDIDWYPWLNKPYFNLIKDFYKSKRHHALLLQSHEGNGELSLLYAICRWLICKNPININNCGICSNCKLMQIGNYSNYYLLKPENKQFSVGIDSIRITLEKLYHSSSDIKIICLPNSELLTEQASNSLLKTLEQPPSNTYFIFGCKDINNLLPTFVSRCLYFKLSSPDEECGLRWLLLQNNHNQYYDCLKARVALRLCNFAPLQAFILLKPQYWQERLRLCNIIKQSIHHYNFLQLLPYLNQDNDNNDRVLKYLLSLIMDALKLQQGIKNMLINIDQLELTINLANRFSSKILHYRLQKWLNYRRLLQTNIGINSELLLINQLLNWEKDFKQLK